MWRGGRVSGKQILYKYGRTQVVKHEIAKWDRIKKKKRRVAGAERRLSNRREPKLGLRLAFRLFAAP